MDNNRVVLARPPPLARNNTDAAGWDPYEVWRTRVLLPRIAAEQVARRVRTADIQQPYVVSSAIHAAGRRAIGDARDETLATDDRIGIKPDEQAGVAVFLTWLALILATYDERTSRRLGR